MTTKIYAFAIIFVSYASTFCQAECPTVIAFTKSDQALGDTRSFGLAVADVDRDGDNDIFVANYIGPSRLWLNDGNGVFSPSPQNFALSEVHDVGIADFNGDTYPDIFLLSHASPSKVYFNNGDATFTAGTQNIGVGSDYPGMMVLGDVDRDGDIDAFIAYYLVPNRLWLNDGNGVFSQTPTVYGGGNGGDMALADFDGDTFLDLCITFSDQPDEIWINDGSGNFVNSGQALGGAAGYENAVCGDVDGDGDIDLAMGNPVVGVSIWLNQDNSGSFVQAGSYYQTDSPKITLFDADADGDLDLISTSQHDGNRLWIDDGLGIFASAGSLFGTAPVSSLECGRLNNDDRVDVVLGVIENSGGNPIYFNEFADTCCCDGVCGDANGDEAVNLADAVYIINYVFKGGPPPDPPASGDANGDGAADLADAVYIINFIFKGGLPPVCLDTVPVLTTAEVSEITHATASCGGTVASDGGAHITARGVCWSTIPTPTVADSKTSDGTGVGEFTSLITGLEAKTTYCIAAYATNHVGTGYGSIRSFTTTDSMGTVTDIDGNTYRTIKIGNQWWMAENLKVTHYRDGDSIPNVTDGPTWRGLTTGAYCEYDNDADSVATYGRLYNWYAVADVRNIAPPGWHVASDAEWKQLEMYLGMSQPEADQTGWRGTDEGGKLKESGTSHWISPNTGATNETGFTGLPGGYRYLGGLYYDIGVHAVFWSSTENGSGFAWCRNLGNVYSGVHRYDGGKEDGFSVRCVKD